MDTRQERFTGNKITLVEQEIRRQIELGNFRRNSALPPERQLAQQLNVSYMTVRRAISNMVNENVLTRLHGKGTYIRGDVPIHRMQQTLGVVMPAWESPEHADLMMLFTELAEKHDYLLKFFLCRGWEDWTIRDAYESCDCLILVPPASLNDIPQTEQSQLAGGDKPIVVFGLDATRLGLDSVIGDNCTDLAIDELRRLGHRRIGLFSQVELHGENIRRCTENYYRNWSRKMSEEFTPEEIEKLEVRLHVQPYALPHQPLYDYLYVNASNLPFTALILSLSSAWGILAAARDIGLAIPEQLAVFCLGDRQEAAFYRPRPTIARVAYRRHIELAIKALKRRQSSPQAVVKCFSVSPELLPGETT